MPFIKQKRRAETVDDETPRKKKAEGEKEKHFKPTTIAELREIEKRARKRDEERKRVHVPDTEEPVIKSRKQREVDRMMQNKPLKNFAKEKFLARYFKILGEKREAYLAEGKNDPRWAWSTDVPQYDASKKERLALHQFVFDINMTLGDFSWSELARLISAAMGKDYRPPDFSTAFHFAGNLMLHALGVTENNKGRYQIASLDDVLEVWPAPIQRTQHVRKSKKDESTKREKNKKRGSRKR